MNFEKQIEELKNENGILVRRIGVLEKMVVDNANAIIALDKKNKELVDYTKTISELSKCTANRFNKIIK